MMKLTLEAILRNLVGKGNKAAKATEPDDSKDSTTIRLNPRTKHWLQCQAAALGGTSLTAVINMILDGVAETSMDNTSGTLRTMRERFFYVFQAHGLDLPSIVSLMSAHGFTMSALDNPQRMMDLLDRSALEHVATTFNVRYDWLTATRDTVIDRGSALRWYKNAFGIAKTLIQYSDHGLNPHVMFVRQEGANFEAARSSNDASEQYREPITVIIRLQRSTGDGAKFFTYHVCDFERWSYWRCRDHYKLLITFCDQAEAKGVLTYGGFELDKEELESLRSGRELPAVILKGFQQVAWYPDDYACLRDDVTKEVDDWPSVKKQYLDGHFEDLFEVKL